MVPEIKVGIAGWSYDDWRGVVYPRSCKDTLRFCAEFVDYIEINSTNAGSPPIENVNGSVNAISIAPVSPGIAPTMTPRDVPNAISPNAVGVNRNWMVGIKSGKTPLQS